MPDRSRIKNKLRRERINVSCACGAALKAPKNATGKRVKCPRCGKTLTVPAPGSVLDEALSALGDEEANKPALEEQPAPPEPVKTDKGKLCPRCNREMSLDAVFCIHCGYHLERGAHCSGATGSSSGGLLAKFLRRKK